jgi:hypothetical protein
MSYLAFSPRRGSVLLIVALSAAACVVKSITVHEIPASGLEESPGGVVASPVKLHLLDGSTVVYADGITLAGRLVEGRGVRYDLTLTPTGQVSILPLDSVAAMESYRAVVRPVETTLLSALGVAASAGGAALLALAIFGSCPTVYSDSAGVPVLEAESFSYSIAPMFEMRDVDRLRVRASQGIVKLEIRNEALETHYINHLELLEIAHPSDALVLPDAAGRPLAARGLMPPLAAHDRAGRDWRTELANSDGTMFRSDSSLLASASATDLEDWLDLSFLVPVGADSVALVLRLQNSLLTTVLFYDVMLRELGHHAVDWIGRDLERIDAAVELGRWAREQLGLQVEIFDGVAYRPTGWLRDVGPIAAKDVALVLPTFGADTLRLRLRFTVDNWRIDRIALASSWWRSDPRAIPVARIVAGDGADNPAALAAVAAPDEHYLETRPGQRFLSHFNVGPEPARGTRTFLLASQGYYIEWIRQPWLTATPTSERFTPGVDAIHRAITRWRQVQDSTERVFYASRIPVR